MIGGDLSDEPWSEVPLSQLLTSMESGSRPRGGVRGIEEGVPSLGGEHLDAMGGFKFEKVKYVPSAFYDSMKRGHIRRDDLLVVKDGATTGKVAIVNEDFPFAKAVANEHLFVCRPNDSVDPEYLFWFLFSPVGQRRVLEHFRGSAQGGITRAFADGTNVPMPPIAVQRRLAALLREAYGYAVGADTQLAMAEKTIQRFRQSVLFAACSGRLTSDWRDENPDAASDELLNELARKRESSGKNVKPPSPIAETQLPEVPDTWRWASVDSISSAVVDGVHKKPNYVDEGIPFVTVKNLTAGPGISFDGCRYVTEEDHRTFTKRTKPTRGDILISKDGTLGVTRAIRTDVEFSIFVSVAMVKPLDYRMTDYLEIAFSSPSVQKQMVGVGSGLLHVVLRDLKADGIPVPPIGEQQEIVRRVRELFALADKVVDQMDSSKAHLARASQSIMSKAFQGEL